jgi:hypothetical protein
MIFEQKFQVQAKEKSQRTTKLLITFFTVGVLLFFLIFFIAKFI